MIHLVDIDPGNWRLKLEVAESQKHHVANSSVMLARAYAYREQRSRAFVIYDDETPVGMGLYYDLPDLDCYDLSQIFIDERYQGRGYGRAATKLILDAMKQDGKYNKVDLCYIEGNDAAKKLYESFGFVEIDRDEDEIIMEMNLSMLTTNS
jgi:diamine N-acetyltransferase